MFNPSIESTQGNERGCRWRSFVEPYIKRDELALNIKEIVLINWKSGWVYRKWREFLSTPLVCIMKTWLPANWWMVLEVKFLLLNCTNQISSFYHFSRRKQPDWRAVRDCEPGSWAARWRSGGKFDERKNCIFARQKISKNIILAKLYIHYYFRQKKYSLNISQVLIITRSEMEIINQKFFAKIAQNFFNSRRKRKSAKI